jgi:hypothetical protein
MTALSSRCGAILCFAIVVIVSRSAHAQNIVPQTGVFQAAASTLKAQQNSGNELVPGTLQWEAAEKAREQLLEAAEKESGGAQPPSLNPVIKLPSFPLSQNGNTIKIPTK